MPTKRLEPIHPGEILEEEFMRPLGLSANAVAKRIDVPVTRISEIVRGKRGITADTALRLAHLLGTTPDLWLGLQTDYDLRVARRDLGGAILTRIVPVTGPSSKYGEGAARPPSAVAEDTPPYAGADVLRRDRDRRRIRRAPSSRRTR